jgi:hypothetical protein
MVLEDGAYGYLPFFSGIDLQTTYIYPAVVAEPGSVAPGQELTIIASPIAPANLYFLTSLETGSIVGYDAAVGSNVTATLISPSGKTVSSASLAYQPCREAVRVCLGGASMLNGYLSIPKNSTAGLYTILLNAAYGSDTVGHTINGSFFSQIWVASGSINPVITVEPGFISATAPSDTPVIGNFSGSQLYQGEQAHVVAKIAYSNGTGVKYGEYTALVYPHELQNQYTALMHTEYANSELVQLAFDPAINAWLGNVTLPSPSGAGTISPVNSNAISYSGPYDVYVTGMTVDGVTTTTALAAQQPFFIQPYTYVAGGAVSSVAQSSQLAFSGATITASGALNGDLFLGTNTVQGGTLTITSCEIDGNLIVNNANVTLVGVSGGDVTASGSTLTLRDSSVGSLSLSGSKVILSDSSYRRVTPALPTFLVTGLSSPISGSAQFTVAATGQGLTTSSLAAWVDGSSVSLTPVPTSSGVSATVAVDATSLSDGVHSLVVTATQSDDLSSTLATPFSTNAQATLLGNQVGSLSSQLKQANASISSLSSQLKQAGSSTGAVYLASGLLLALAVAAVAIGVTVFRRKPGLV